MSFEPSDVADETIQSLEELRQDDRRVMSNESQSVPSCDSELRHTPLVTSHLNTDHVTMKEAETIEMDSTGKSLVAKPSFTQPEKTVGKPFSQWLPIQTQGDSTSRASPNVPEKG